MWGSPDHAAARRGDWGAVSIWHPYRRSSEPIEGQQSRNCQAHQVADCAIGRLPSPAVSRNDQIGATAQPAMAGLRSLTAHGGRCSRFSLPSRVVASPSGLTQPFRRGLYLRAGQLEWPLLHTRHPGLSGYFSGHPSCTPLGRSRTVRGLTAARFFRCASCWASQPAVAPRTGCTDAGRTARRRVVRHPRCTQFRASRRSTPWAVLLTLAHGWCPVRRLPVLDPDRASPHGGVTWPQLTPQNTRRLSLPRRAGRRGSRGMRRQRAVPG